MSSGRIVGKPETWTRALYGERQFPDNAFYIQVTIDGQANLRPPAIPTLEFVD
jgi:hypothetical protein